MKRALFFVIILFFSVFSVFAYDTIVKEYPDETVTYEYENGYLIKEISVALGVKKETSYHYINGKLVMCTTVHSNSQENEVIFFLRSPSTNELIAVKRGDSLTYVEDSFVAQNELIIKTESLFETLEDGTTVIVTENARYEYSTNGVLSREIREDSTIEYFYEEGKLISTKAVYNDGKSKVENYEDGIIVKTEEYDSLGVMISSILYDSDSTGGMVKTLYDNGRPIAVVYYKEDNKRIDRIEYL